MKVFHFGFTLGAGMMVGVVGGVVLMGAAYLGYCKIRNMIEERKNAGNEPEKEG